MFLLRSERTRRQGEGAAPPGRAEPAWLNGHGESTDVGIEEATESPVKKRTSNLATDTDVSHRSRCRRRAGV